VLAHFKPLGYGVEGAVRYTLYYDRSGRVNRAEAEEILLNSQAFGLEGSAEIEKLIEECRKEKDWNKLETIYHEDYHARHPELFLGMYVDKLDMKRIEAPAYVYGKLKKNIDKVTAELGVSGETAKELAYKKTVKEIEEEIKKAKEMGRNYFLQTYALPGLKLIKKLNPLNALEMLEEYGNFSSYTTDAS